MTRGGALRLIALIFCITGSSHFFAPEMFERIVPSWVPNPHAVVFWSGIAELAGAIGLLIPQTRVWAAYGLITLLVVVFPANVRMLLDAQSSGASAMYIALLWVRLPLQPLLIWWVWKAAIAGRSSNDR